MEKKALTTFLSRDYYKLGRHLFSYPKGDIFEIDIDEVVESDTVKRQTPLEPARSDRFRKVSPF